MAWINFTEGQKNAVLALLETQSASPETDGLKSKLIEAFEPMDEESEQILSIAQDMRYVREGEVEIDFPGEGNTVISPGGDNGAYVMAWVWADFSGTPLDKENED